MGVVLTATVDRSPSTRHAAARVAGERTIDRIEIDRAFVYRLRGRGSRCVGEIRSVATTGLASGLDAASDSGARKLKIFISYARDESGFAGMLRARLRAAGYEPLMDDEMILPGQEWRPRLARLVDAATLVAFVISPSSTTSEVCDWEINLARTRGKRLIPIAFRPPSEQSLPTALGAAQRVDFRSLGDAYADVADAAIALRAIERRRTEAPDAYQAAVAEHERALATFKARPETAEEFDGAFAELDKAIRLDDFEWEDGLAAWMGRVRDWETRGRPSEGLLPTDDIVRLEDFAAKAPAGREAPAALADLLKRSIEKRDDDERARDRTIQRGFVVPTAQLSKDGRHDEALRRMAAGAILSRDPDLRLDDETPPPNRAALWEAGRRSLPRAPLRILRGHEGRVVQACFSPDGMRILTGSFDATARVWDAASGAELARLEGHGDWVRAAVWSPDGTRILTGSWDETARVWESSSGAELVRLEGHGDALQEAEWLEGFSHGVEAAAWSPDGGRIVTGSGDATARVWDASSGAELARLEGHGGWVKTVSWSSDGSRILTGSDYGTSRIWDVRWTEALTSRFARAEQLAAALGARAAPEARIGRIAAGEASDLLMQQVAEIGVEDLCAAMIERAEQLAADKATQNGEDPAAARAAARDRILECAEILEAPRDPGCYLAPTQRSAELRAKAEADAAEKIRAHLAKNAAEGDEEATPDASL